MSGANVSVIVVNYNTESYIYDNVVVLNDLFDEVIVVDNSGSYFSVCDEVVLRYGNVGFGVGCNLGAQYASSEGLFFINPDFHLNPDVLKKFISTANSLCPSNFYVPLSDDKYWDITLDNTFLRRIPVKSSVGTVDVNFLSGCSFFASRLLFLSISGFDQSIFMYCEDLELSLRLKSRNIKVKLLPFKIGSHVGGGSFRTIWQKINRLWLSFRGHRQVLGRHMSEPLRSVNSIYLALGIR
jgi:GT2 family glycosyltransferase